MSSEISNCEMLSVFKHTRASKYYNYILSKQNFCLPSSLHQQRNLKKHSQFKECLSLFLLLWGLQRRFLMNRQWNLSLGKTQYHFYVGKGDHIAWHRLEIWDEKKHNLKKERVTFLEVTISREYKGWVLLYAL